MKFTIPSLIATERLVIRPYHVDDGNWYYEMSMRNKAHLQKYESENPVMSIRTSDDAVRLVKAFAN